MSKKKLPNEPTDGDVVAATEQFIEEIAAARMRFEVYRDATTEWRWRLVSANNRIIAVSGEGYKNRADCRYAISLVQQSHAADVVEVES